MASRDQGGPVPFPRRTSAVLLICAWVLTTLGGCSDTETGLRVVFDADPEIRENFDQVSILIRSAGPDDGLGEPLDLRDLRGSDLPRVIAVRPAGGDSTRQAYLRMEGVGDSCTARVEQVIGFRPDRVDDVRIHLSAACCGDVCPDGQTCEVDATNPDVPVCQPICSPTPPGLVFDPETRTCSPRVPGGAPPPPALVDFTIEPAVASPGSTFTFTAEGPPESEMESLTYAWDFDEDGTADATGSMVERAWTEAGIHVVRLRVEGGAGGALEVEGYAVVATTASTVTVTTGEDTTDPDDGQTTLREALQQVQDMAGPQVITFAQPLTVMLEDDISLEDNGTVVAGFPGVVIDGSNHNGNECMYVRGDAHTLLGLEFQDCPRNALQVAVFADNNWIARCTIHGSSRHAFSLGRNAGNRIGPGNRAYNNETGAAVEGQQQRIDGNYFYMNRQAGVLLYRVNNANERSGDPVVTGNTLWANAVGVSVGDEVDRAKLWHNTIHGSADSAILFQSGASTDHEIRNNILSDSGSYGLAGTVSATVVLDHNLYDANLLGVCESCTPGDNAQMGDAGYRDRNLPDFRLVDDSPALDSGADVGEDRNGGAPGAFAGTAPDRGAWERQ